jgi:hypothetical protein
VSRYLLAFTIATVPLALGCCKTPLVAAGSGPGFFAADPHVVAARAASWPPPSAQSGSCDEIADFESAGVQHTACPTFQAAAVPATGDADAPIASGNANFTCYSAGPLMVVVSYAQQYGPKTCRHVTGIALLPAKEPK